jgi:hypothetical protein
MQNPGRPNIDSSSSQWRAQRLDSQFLRHIETIIYMCGFSRLLGEPASSYFDNEIRCDASFLFFLLSMGKKQVNVAGVKSGILWQIF